MNLEDLFENAKLYPSSRQSFLEILTIQEPSNYINRVFYTSQDKKMHLGYVLMQTEPNIKTKFAIRKQKSTLRVFPVAFNKGFHKNLDDFLSTFCDHEYFHAMEFYKNPNDIIIPLTKLIPLYLKEKIIKTYSLQVQFTKLVYLREERALKNQIKNFQNRNCSNEYMQKIKTDWQNCKNNIDQINCYFQKIQFF